MNRVWGRVWAGVAAVAGGACLTAACTHDNSTIFVLDVLQPQEVAAGQSCQFNTDTTQPYLSEGILDIDFPADGWRVNKFPEYTAIFLVGNQMVPEGNPQTPATETSYVQIETAIVTITDPSGTQTLNSFSVPVSATIPPLTGSTPSFVPIIGVPIVDATTVENQVKANGVEQRGTAVVITSTRFRGHSLGGELVESGNFKFPVTICRGCLITYSPQDVQASMPIPNCFAAATMMAASALPVPCPHPDFGVPIDCSQCLGVCDCLHPTECNP